MSKLFTICTVLLLIHGLQAQEYIPLTLDSAYHWSWFKDFETGDTIITETWSGYSYDTNDTLTQRRDPGFRYNYTYSPDTTYVVSEALDMNGQWNAIHRTTKAYHHGLPISKLNERYQNKAWEKTANYSYYYGSSGEDTLLLLQHWKEGQWVNFYKKEKSFDPHGNCIEEKEYYADEDQTFLFNRGKLFAYNEDNLKIEETNVNVSVNGPYYTSKSSWIFNEENQLDTIIRCNFPYPNDGSCSNAYLYMYAHESIHTNEYSFRWFNHGWDFLSKRITYNGPEIYSSKPDSVITHSFLDNTDQQTRREYYAYQPLNVDTIYFKQEEYNYFTLTEEWLLTRLTEEWYHIKSTVKTASPDNLSEVLPLFPNPAKAGQRIFLDQSIQHIPSGEIFIFDMNGKLISIQKLSPSSILAPSNSGIYTILVRSNNRTIGLSKHAIID